MSFTFTSATNYPYRPSTIFLGIDPATGHEVGLQTERHLFCAAGSRSGKGVGLIVQNLKRWPHATLVIDPKGENSEITWQDRLAMGQTVAVLDPFKEAAVPEQIRASFNPLDGLTLDRPRGRELIQDIADGVITKYNDDHMEWVVGARDIVAGVIAYVIATLPQEYINLPSVRALINNDKEVLELHAREMMKCDAFGGLAKAAGNIILKAIHSDKGMPPQLLDMAQRGSAWIDSDDISECLCRTSFDIGGLKQDSLSLYLVLPPKEIRTYRAFFRLMIKTALNIMMTGGTKSKGRCLFILDEFASLDKLDELEEAAGRMPAYGVHLWPFVQQIGQLQKLYGKEGAETFLGNADAQIYFNPQDSLTLEYMSKWAGRFKPRELAGTPPIAPVMIPTKEPDSSDAELNAISQAAYQTKMSIYNDAMRLSGTPRLTPSEIMALTGKGNDEKIARSMIVFSKAGDVLNLWIAPYYMTIQELVDSKFPKTETSLPDARWPLIPWGRLLSMLKFDKLFYVLVPVLLPLNVMFSIYETRDRAATKNEIGERIIELIISAAYPILTFIILYVTHHYVRDFALFGWLEFTLFVAAVYLAVCAIVFRIFQDDLA